MRNYTANNQQTRSTNMTLAAFSPGSSTLHEAGEGLLNRACGDPFFTRAMACIPLKHVMAGKLEAPELLMTNEPGTLTENRGTAGQPANLNIAATDESPERKRTQNA